MTTARLQNTSTSIWLIKYPNLNNIVTFQSYTNPINKNIPRTKQNAVRLQSTWFTWILEGFVHRNLLSQYKNMANNLMIFSKLS